MGDLAPPVGRILVDRYYTVWDVCQSCGTIVDDKETLRCPQCGSELTQRVPSPQPLVSQEARRAVLRVLFFLFGAVAVLFGLFAVLSGLVLTGCVCIVVGGAALYLAVASSRPAKTPV
jgi:rRNA maturation protein Nop10